MHRFGAALLLMIMPNLFGGAGLKAQTPTDAIMMDTWEACFGAVYEFGRFDRYWEGETLRHNQTIETVQRQSGSLMGVLGFPANINLLVGGSYVWTHSTEPNGGFFKGQRGLQDLSVTLKARLFRFEANSYRVDLLASAGVITPMSAYHADYMPYSIGLGTTEWNGRAIVQYQHSKGTYARAAGGFLHRGLTQTDREYYYNNGSHYTHDMDVPDAVDFHAVLGHWFIADRFRAELNYMGMRSLFGDDIRAYNRAQPTNKVHVDQIGILFQYFLEQRSELGFIGYANHVVHGRNMARMTRFGAGLTYFINSRDNNAE